MKDSKVKQGKLRTVLKWASCMFVFALTIEICARIDDCFQYDAPFFSSYTASRLQMQDDDGIPCNVPNIRFERWRNNRFGFRGADIQQAKPDERIRIVCVGTSETYGLTETDGKEWTAQLATMLREKGDYEVINAGVLGLSLNKFQPFMDKYVFPFDPDIIYLLISPYSYVARQERTVGQATQPVVLDNNKKAGSGLSVGNLIANIRVMPKTKQVVKQFIPASLMQNYLVWTTARDLRAKEEQALKGATPKNRIPEHILSQYRQDVEELLDYIASKNIKVILGSYPVLLVRDNINNFPFMHFATRMYMVEYSLEGLADISNRIDSLTEVIAIEHGLGFVDNRKSPPHDADYYADGVHCTDTGSALLAKNIVNYIDSMP